MLHFAKGLHRAAVDRSAGEFDYRAYRPLLVQGKTACIVGAGGIGLEVGRLCAALGMRVVGTRRRPEPGAPLPAGFSELGGPGDLDRFLASSDFVAICCQWTPETTNLFNAQRFAAMKAGAVLVNVARGEIVDEQALADALARNHLRGAALDVYVGEFERPPRPRAVVRPARADHAAHLQRQRRGAPRRHRHLLRQPARLPRRPPPAQRHRLGAGLLERISIVRVRCHAGISRKREYVRSQILCFEIGY